MANTQQVKLTANFVDGDGVRSSARAYAKIDPGSTVTEAVAMLTGYLNAIVACSDAGLVGASMSIEDLASPVGSTPASTDSSVDEVGVLDFHVPNSGRTFGFPIPGLKDSLIVNSKIVTDSGAGQTLANLLSGGATGIDYCGNDFLQLGSLTQTFRSNRKHRRALRSVSRNAV